MKAVPAGDAGRESSAAAAGIQPTAFLGKMPEAELPFAKFRAWADAEGASSAAPHSLARGVELARERRAALAALISTDPERALAEAVPPLVRQRLPAEVRALLEEPVSARASFRVLAALPTTAAGPPAVRREVVLPGGATYAASVYGARLRQPTADNVPLTGIALDGTMAVAESPVRVMARGEVIPAGKPVEATCPVSGESVVDVRPTVVEEDDLAAEIGGTVQFFCGAGHLADVTDQLHAAVRDAAGPPATDSSYNQGTKRILLVRLNFTDDLAEPMTVAAGQSLLAATDAFISENSYGTTRIDLANSLVTPVVITMPKTKAAYAADQNSSITFLADARAAATAAGYNYLSYDFEWFRYASIYGFSGQAYVGARGVWLQTSSTGVACHEWGHNLGVWHANLWAATNDTVIGAGTNTEYGDTYDTMGSASAGNRSFNACHRWLLGWLPNGNVLTATTSGTYRIHAFDQNALTAGQPLAVRTPKDATRFYWLEHRVQWSTNATLANGVILHWSPWASSNGGTSLLDLAPGGTAGTGDAALVVGRTFSDPYAGVHITPIARNAATTPPSVDVVINRGAFPGNQPPTLSLSASAATAAVNASVTFTAAASDPDGDALAYWWDFGNGAVGPNAAAASASWPAAGVYLVRCTASDMKGGTSVRSVVVTVGAPTTFAASGRVVNDYGRAVAGVRVHNGLTGTAYRGTYTNDDGRYTLANLAAGSYTLHALSSTFTGEATAGFANPVAVSANAAGFDFTGTLVGPIVAATAPAQPPREAGSIPADFTIARGAQAPATSALTVFYTLAGVASRTADYTVAAVPPATGTFDPATGVGTLTLPAGAATALLRLTPVDDALPEGAENVILTMTTGARYQLSDAPAVALTIADNDAPDVYTETFASGATTLRPFDLNNRRLTFTPTSAAAYAGASDPALGFPVDPAGGTVLAAGGAATVALTSGTLTGGSWRVSGLSVSPKLFGQAFSQIYVNTSGNVTFESGDNGSDSAPSLHFTSGRRRVSLFGASLDLSKGGTISYRVVSGPPRVVVTFANVPANNTGAAVLNAQAELGADGTVTITHLGTTLGDGVVGLAGGQSVPNPFYATDLSAYGPSLAGFNAWLAGRFTPAELNDPAVGGPGADPDGDGWSNLLEYALGSDPRAAGLPPGAPAAGRSGAYLTLTFQRNPALTDLTYAVEASADLGGTWTEIARSVAGGATAASPGQSPSSLDETPAANGAVSATVGDVTPSGPGAPRRFLRLRVLRP